MKAGIKRMLRLGNTFLNFSHNPQKMTDIDALSILGESGYVYPPPMEEHAGFETLNH